MLEPDVKIAMAQEFLEEELDEETVLFIRRQFGGQHPIRIVIQLLNQGRRPEEVKTALQSVDARLMTPFIEYGALAEACNEYASRGRRMPQDMISLEEAERFWALGNGFSLLANRERDKITP